MQNDSVCERAALSPCAIGLANGSPIDPKSLIPIVAGYRDPNLARRVFELVISMVALALLWAAMFASLKIGYWLTLLLAVPAAGFVVRIFMIQHDCGHGAFFRRRSVNDWLGRVLGIITLTPYDVWRRAHGLR